MEIEEKLYQQYRDTPYKINDSKQNQKNSNQDDLELENFGNSYNEYLGKINDGISDQKGRSLTNNITLKNCVNKSNQNNDQENYLLDNINNLDNMNSETKNIASKNDDEYININEQIKFNNKNKKRNNIININNLYNNEILSEKNGNIINNNNFDKKNIEDKVMIFNENYGGKTISNNYNSLSEKEKNINENCHYFSKKNIIKANDSNYVTIDNKNNKFNKTNFILTVIVNNKESNKENEGLFSGFCNFCKKKNEKNNNKEYTNLKNSNNELELISQKLRDEPYDFDNKLKEDNKKEGNYENIILASTENRKFKYNFVLSNLLNEKNNNNDIIKLKNGLNNDHNKERQYYLENQNLILSNKNIQNNEKDESFIENQNIYYNQNRKDKKSYYIVAEPIENNNKTNNFLEEEEENNLGTSSEIIDFDKSSEYTLETGTNIDQLVKKNSKISSFMIAISIGSVGLLFLLYNKKKIRKFLLNFLEKLKELDFFSGLLIFFRNGIDDFLERYNDSYRFLGFLILLICFWIIIKLLMKFARYHLRKK